jgi:hypothetical protein
MCHIPSSRIQIPTYSQAPNAKLYRADEPRERRYIKRVVAISTQRRRATLELGVGTWECIGIWSLELGS